MEKQARIQEFIQQQTVASVCSAAPDGSLHAFSCYYAFDATQMLLYFKTGEETRHMQQLHQLPALAGTILPDKLNKLQVKGIQLRGVLLASDDELGKNAAKTYHAKYPFALAMPGTVYAIKIEWIKMTDNSLGFGTKLEWERPGN